ncbi:MAG: nucleoside-diphosphate sugar epimerase/dehydratase, partial [Blastocatellia bacterium]
MGDGATVVAEQSRVATRRRSLAVAAFSVFCIVAVDFVISLLVFLVAFKLRNHTYVFARDPGTLIPRGFSPEFQPYLAILTCVPFVKVYLLRKYGLYRLKGEFAFNTDFAGLFRASTFSFLVLVLIAFLFRQGFTIHHGKVRFVDFSYSRLIFVFDWILSMAMFALVRIGVRTAQVIYRARGRNLIPTVVVGCDEMALVCIQEISQKPRLGHKLEGVITASPEDDISAVKGRGVRLLGDFASLPDLVKRFNIEEVLITDTRINPSRLFEVLMECGRDHQIKYRVVPNLFNCMPGKTEVATIGTL